MNVAILANPADPSIAPQIRELDSAADLLGIHLEHFEALTPEQFDTVSATMGAQHTEAILITSGAFLPYRNKLAELAMKYRLPTITAFREFTEAGSLLSYGVNMADFAGKAAVYVDKILKGAKPADLAMEQPTKFELLINVKTAKWLGITFSPVLLATADMIIE